MYWVPVVKEPRHSHRLGWIVHRERRVDLADDRVGRVRQLGLPHCAAPTGNKEGRVRLGHSVPRRVQHAEAYQWNACCRGWLIGMPAQHSTTAITGPVQQARRGAVDPCQPQFRSTNQQLPQRPEFASRRPIVCSECARQPVHTLTDGLRLNATARSVSASLQAAPPPGEAYVPGPALHCAFPKVRLKGAHSKSLITCLMVAFSLAVWQQKSGAERSATRQHATQHTTSCVSACVGTAAVPSTVTVDPHAMPQTHS